MRVLAIDPGHAESAYVLLNERGVPEDWEKVPNEDLLQLMDHPPLDDTSVLAIEMVASYGMPVGSEVFDTCVWIGRFLERWGGKTRQLVYRKDVMLHLCNQRNAKDANIRAALIDRFGPGKDVAVGLKKSPGPLYGLTGDCWSALAVAVTVVDTEAPAA